MYRMDRSEMFKGWFIPAVLLYCAQFFFVIFNELPWIRDYDVIYLFYIAQAYNEFAWLIPMIVCLPFATKFCEDWQSRFFHLQIWRASPGQYVRSKVLHTFLTGALTGVLGAGLFFGIFCVLCECPIYPSSDISDIAWNMLWRSGNLWVYLAELTVRTFWFGGFWALVGLAFSAFVPYRALVLCFPGFMHRLYRIIFSITQAPAWMNLEAWGMFTNRSYTPGISMLMVTGIFGVLSAVCSIIFYAGVKRRLENG